MSTPTRRRIFDDNNYVDEFVDRPSARSLKPPPEIWELVQPVQQEQFKPTRTFLSRLATRNVMFATLGTVLVLGAAFAAWRFRVVQNVWTALSEPETPARQSTATTKRSVPEKPKPAPVAVAPIPAATESNAITVSEPAPSAPGPGTKRIVRKPLKAVVAASFGSSPLSTSTTTKPIGEKVSSVQSATTEKSVSSGNQPAPSQPAKPKANPPTTSEAVAPAKTTTPPKPKVIQWP